jgi:predicted metal-dependent phosphoesterase TrpH
MPRYDLHCHSTHSDGLLAPAAVVARAGEHGVDVLALTDHDEVDGLAEALDAALDAGITLICGSELSVTWAGITIHVLALGIDPTNAALARASPEFASGVRPAPGASPMRWPPPV